MNLRFTIYDLRFTILFLLAGTLQGATYYVGPSATGSGSGADRSNLMSLAAFRDTTSAPDDIALLQPGSYGTLTLNPTTGTNLGTSGHPIIYRADPATCTARSADWFTRTTALETANPAIHPVCSGISIKKYRQTIPPVPNDCTDAQSYFITLDGLWSTAYVYFEFCAGDVTITNCNVAVAVTQYLSTSDDYAIQFRNYSGHGSDFYNITISNCYLSGGGRTVAYQAQFSGAVYLTNCRLTNCVGSFITWGPTASEVLSYHLYVDGCHVDKYQKSANDASPQTRTITAVDGAEPRRIFTVSADVSSTYLDFVDFTHGGVPKQEIRLLGYHFDHATRVVTMATPVTFDFAVGVDTAQFMDDGHGSGVNISGDHLTIDQTIFHNLGDTAGMYIYKNLGSTGAHDLTITNNLCYTSLNAIWAWSLGGTYDDVGNNLTLQGNTIIGLHSPSTDSTHPAAHYGRALGIEANAGADTSTWNISNNLICGLLQGHLGNAVRCGNIVYAHGAPFPHVPYDELLNGADPNNTGNLIIYAGEPLGSEPEPFHKAGTYFVADAANFDDVFTSDGFTDVNTGDYFNFNLYADFVIKADSPARGAGDANFATTYDLAGTTRGSPPDVGAYEYEAYLPTPPTAATNPSPADGAISQSPTVQLSWTTGGNSPTHHMFFGTVLQDVANGTGGTDKGTQTIPYNPGTLAVLTSYHWRVQEENADGNEPGTVWHFTTRPAVDPVYYLIGGSY